MTILVGDDCPNEIPALISCLEIICITVIKKQNHSFQKGFRKVAYSSKVSKSPCPFSFLACILGTANVKEDNLALKSVRSTSAQITYIGWDKWGGKEAWILTAGTLESVL